MTSTVLLSYDDTPPEGGQGVLVRDIRAHLGARGVAVATVSGRGDHAVPFRRVTGRAPLDFSLHVQRHPELYAAAAGDVVTLMGGPGGVLLPRPARHPVVVIANHTYRQAYSRTSPRRALSRIERATYMGADRVLPISQSTADVVVAMGVRSARVEVLRPGVDLPAADGTRHEPGRILFVGRLEREKGVMDALSVMAALTESRADVRGVIAGVGSLEDDVRRACEHTVGVDYIGRIDDDRRAAEYARASIVLVPSRYEGLGLVALEAMAAGAVVIGYDVVGLRDAALGVAPLVARGDISAMIAECRRLLDSPAKRDELSEAGRAAVEREHSWETYVDRLIAVYGDVAASARG